MGNHDWVRGRDGGWEAVRRQAAFIADAAREGVLVLPAPGCPGPATRDLGDRLRLVLLDTQWWLHGSDRPEDPTSSCPADSKGEITAALREAVAGDPNRHVVVAGHHPLRSGGVHGGKFDWKDHIFPLRAYKNWMWLPLPLIGSLYPLVRGSGISAQDAAAGSNEEMRDSIRAAFDARPPLAYAAGHEHNLQIIAEDSGTILVVSGTGSFDHTSQVFRLGESRYASAASGFIRVDVLRDGRVRIAVIVVDEAGRRSEDFSAWVGSERR